MPKKLLETDCPVCGKTHFVPPAEKEEQKLFFEGEFFCEFCGWHYDLAQLRNYRIRTKLNPPVYRMRLDYQDALLLNPRYRNGGITVSARSEPHPCPCCGEYRFSDRDCFEICPVCGWQDDGWYKGGGANGMTLDEAKRQFDIERQKNPDYTRCPMAEDESLDYLSLRERCGAEPRKGIRLSVQRYNRAIDKRIAHLDDRDLSLFICQGLFLNAIMPRVINHLSNDPASCLCGHSELFYVVYDHIDELLAFKDMLLGAFEKAKQLIEAEPYEGSEDVLSCIADLTEKLNQI